MPQLPAFQVIDGKSGAVGYKVYAAVVFGGACESVLFGQALLADDLCAFVREYPFVSLCVLEDIGQGGACEVSLFRTIDSDAFLVAGFEGFFVYSETPLAACNPGDTFGQCVYLFDREGGSFFYLDGVQDVDELLFLAVEQVYPVVIRLTPDVVVLIGLDGVEAVAGQCAAIARI